MKLINANVRCRIGQFLRLVVCSTLCFFLLWATGGGFVRAASGTESEVLGFDAERTHMRSSLESEQQTSLIGVGDSLTHGTMDATNNDINTLNAYLQKIADSLSQVVPLHFTQPLFDVQENRIQPFLIPTNVSVDGADSFTVEGIRYYKKNGVDESFVDESLLADKLLPRRLEDKYDKVMYPINVKAWQPMSQIDSTVWLLNDGLPAEGVNNALIIFWVGNNDSSAAALGYGGSNPEFWPLPFDLVKQELKPGLSFLLCFAESAGAVSFEPYTQAAIERNLTGQQDFVDQFSGLITRLETETGVSGVEMDLLLLTLPYYSAVGYLFDSEDLEYYFQKLNPEYIVPPTFKRVAPLGEPITDPLKGDRISFLSFGFMYVLLSSGYSVDYVNQALEINGEQRDGLVLSEEEQQFIMARIDDFNAAIKAVAESHGPNVNIVDVGVFLNDSLAGDLEVVVGDKTLTRKWVRGSAFTLDGVHPSYTGQALIANFVIQELNKTLEPEAPFYDLDKIMETDPYIDQDGDGWAPGPDYEAATGVTELLFLFKDPDDGDPLVEVELPPDVWDQISDALLSLIIDLPGLRVKAEQMGIVPGHP